MNLHTAEFKNSWEKASEALEAILVFDRAVFEANYSAIETQIAIRKRRPLKAVDKLVYAYLMDGLCVRDTNRNENTTVCFYVKFKNKELAQTHIPFVRLSDVGLLHALRYEKLTIIRELQALTRLSKITGLLDRSATTPTELRSIILSDIDWSRGPAPVVNYNLLCGDVIMLCHSHDIHIQSAVKQVFDHLEV